MKTEDIVAEIIVELYLKKDNKALLHKRFNTNYEDGNYGFIGGHVQKDETLKQALIREAQEEAGIILKEENLKCVFIANKTGKKNCINFIFLATKFEGTPKIMEQDKCTDLNWFDINNLPTNIIKLESQVIQECNEDTIKIIEMKV